MMNKDSVIKGAIAGVVVGSLVAGIDGFFLPKTVLKIITENAHSSNEFKYVALGDSLTFGYGISDKSMVYPQIVGKYFGFASTTSLAVDGAMIADVTLLQVPQIPLDTNIVSVFVGANDCQGYAFNPLAGAKYLRQMNKKYSTLLNAIRHRVPHAQIFLMNYPDLNRVVFPADKFPGYPYQDVRVRARGTECMISLNKYLSEIKGYIIVNNAADSRLEQKVSIGPDGVHPSVDGQSFYAENLIDTIQSHYDMAIIHKKIETGTLHSIDK
jgi:lysophospholipase L1-like esterase